MYLLVTAEPDDGPYVIDGDPPGADLDAVLWHAWAAWTWRNQKSWNSSERAAVCHRFKIHILQSGRGVTRSRGIPRSREGVQVVARALSEGQQQAGTDLLRAIATARGIQRDTLRRYGLAAPPVPVANALALPRIVKEPELALVENYDPVMIRKLAAVAASNTAPPASSLSEVERMMFAQGYFRWSTAWT